MFKGPLPAFIFVLLLVLDSSAREPIKSPPATSTVERKAIRASDLGVPFEGTPGKFNAITDLTGSKLATRRSFAAKAEIRAWAARAR